MDNTENEFNITTTLVEFVCMLCIGMIIPNGVDSSAGRTANNLVITLSGNPADGDAITLNSTVFEFDDDSSGWQHPGCE